MKKLLLTFVATLLVAFSAKAGDVEFSTITFPMTGQAAISSYSSSFTGTADGITWTVTNFNNNNNVWTLIKTGTKNGASVGTIANNDAISEAVTKIVVTVSNLTATYLNSAYLEVSSSADFTADVQKTTVSLPPAITSSPCRRLLPTSIIASRSIVHNRQATAWLQSLRSCSTRTTLTPSALLPSFQAEVHTTNQPQ